jgi:putative membrane protein
VEKMMNMGDFGGMGFGFGWIFMILFWALIILGITYFVKQLFGSSKTFAEKESAEEILKKRYAAGEISKDEYRERTNFLKGKA